jgi:hypothetical protein
MNEQPNFEFHGPGYDADLDEERLTTQLQKVYNLMKDGEWRTLLAIAEVSGGLLTSVSAHLRQLRTEKRGSYIVERRRTKKAGLWEYRVLPPATYTEDDYRNEVMGV